MERLSRFHPHFDFFLFGGDKAWLTIESMQKLLHAIGRNPLLPWLVIAVVVVIWLAPITLLGRMPIGGDVTSFFLPLMAYYRQALLDGRVPLWNELWGFGFPMLAESQAGVFYPPHLILFRIFETETAYSLNIVLHHLLAGWFAYLCGREFGLRRWGATLAALVFAGNGFFIIHFPHQWAYTSGCWMPLAVALAWRVVKAEGGRRKAESEDGIPARRERIEDGPGSSNASGWRDRMRAAFGLAAVLAIQMLAGHFQIAFYTQLVVLLIGLLCTMQRVFRGIHSTRKPQSTVSTSPSAASKGKRRRRLRGPIYPWGSPASLVWLGVPLAGAFALAAVQLLPTYELIRIALPEGRNFEYLSGFANTPFHLVSYLLPTLFHVNPLWRPVAWDPFHTSPEECFSYIGLLPICLAVGAAWRWRREPRVRLWVLLALVTTLLSFGPYLLGFRAFILLSGFNGFRSASRWSLAMALFLGLLAGRAVDGLRATDRLLLWLRRELVVFAVTASVAFVLVNGLLAGGPKAPAWIEWLDKGWEIITPWQKEPSLREVAKRVDNCATDANVYAALAGISRINDESTQQIIIGNQAAMVRTASLSSERRAILLQELLPPIVIVAVAFVVFQWLVRRQRVPELLLVAFAAAELGAAGWLRPTDFVPRGPIVPRSPVMTYLSEHAVGQRGSDTLQNLMMLAGAAPVRSYRTVDIQILQPSQIPTFDIGATGVLHDERDRIAARCDIGWGLFQGVPVNRQIPVPARAGDNDAIYVEPDGRFPNGRYYRVVDYDQGLEITALADPLLGRIVWGRGLSEIYPVLTAQFVIKTLPDVVRSRGWFVVSADGGETLDSLLVPRSYKIHRWNWTLDNAFLRLPATPITQTRAEAERADFEVHATGPGAVLFSELYFPGWEASLTNGGRTVSVPVVPAANGCRAVRIAAAGDYRLTLWFNSRTYRRGIVVSLTAGAAWVMLLLLTRFAVRR